LAEENNPTAIAVIVELLRPKKEDSVEDIFDKITIFIRLVFLQSLKYEDAPYHIEIDKTYAEQIHHYLNHGRPRYRGVMIIGYRESAKTSRVVFNETYLAVYLADIADYTSLVSVDGDKSEQINMDIFNILAFSRLTKYFPDIITPEVRSKKKESQRMDKFTTTTGVTYSATSSRVPTRGAMKMDIDASGDVDSKRPKKIIFDDIDLSLGSRSRGAYSERLQDFLDVLDGTEKLLENVGMIASTK